MYLWHEGPKIVVADAGIVADAGSKWIDTDDWSIRQLIV